LENIKNMLEEQDFISVVNRNLRTVKYCYCKALKADPEFEGEAIVGMQVKVSGKVKQVSIEPPEVVYDRKGIHWTGSLPPGRTVSAEVAYIAQGNDRFVLRLPPSRRTRALDIELEMQGVAPSAIPEYALQPTSKEAGTVWSLSQSPTLSSF